MKKTWMLITALTGITGLALAGGADIPYSRATSESFFKGKSPEEIARYLSHPNLIPARAAAQALGAHGEKALPLIKKLLKDKHPGMRGGAMRALSAIYNRSGQPGFHFFGCTQHQIDL